MKFLLAKGCRRFAWIDPHENVPGHNGDDEQLEHGAFAYTFDDEALDCYFPVKAITRVDRNRPAPSTQGGDAQSAAARVGANNGNRVQWKADSAFAKLKQELQEAKKELQQAKEEAQKARAEAQKADEFNRLVCLFLARKPHNCRFTRKPHNCPSRCADLY